MEMSEGKLPTADEVESYLREGERKAIAALAAGKWSMFGYWAAQTVHLRRLLRLSHEPSPFRPLTDWARSEIESHDEAP